MKRGGPVSQDGNRTAPQRMRGPTAGGRATAEPAEAGCRTGAGGGHAFRPANERAAGWPRAWAASDGRAAMGEEPAFSPAC